MRFMSIASGSSGNCSYIGSDNTHLLLDLGISMKRIESGLSNAEISPRDLKAILITHEHIDHIKSLGVISRKYNIPIYATYGTIDGIMTTGSLGTYDYNLLKAVPNNGSFQIGDIRVNVHPVSHDANDPVCYSFEEGDKKISVATDMGIYDDMTLDFLSESNVMLIEANHDIRMLEAGPYPYPLKQRILGKRGHLCNEASGRMIRELLHENVLRIYLGHLSDKNNYPELAYETVKQAIMDNPYTNDIREFGLSVASRNECGEVVEI